MKDNVKEKHKFNYKLMRELNDNKQMKDVWETSLTKPSEKKYGKHPTQKPVALLERIILSSTDENDIIFHVADGEQCLVRNILVQTYIFHGSLP